MITAFVHMTATFVFVHIIVHPGQVVRKNRSTYFYIPTVRFPGTGSIDFFHFKADINLKIMKQNIFYLHSSTDFPDVLLCHIRSDMREK